MEGKQIKPHHLVVGLGVGIPAISYGVKRNYDVQWDYSFSMFYGSQFNYWASILVSLASAVGNSETTGGRPAASNCEKNSTREGSLT